VPEHGDAGHGCHPGESYKRAALPCYEEFKAYQPLNCWWAEQQVMLYSEFRDGNVPAGHEQLRVMKDALVALPASVTTVFLRSDSAACQKDLLLYCGEGKDERFGGDRIVRGQKPRAG
jgi:hypothetical protein